MIVALEAVAFFASPSIPHRPRPHVFGSFCFYPLRALPAFTQSSRRKQHASFFLACSLWRSTTTSPPPPVHLAAVVEPNSIRSSGDGGPDGSASSPRPSPASATRLQASWKMAIFRDRRPYRRRRHKRRKRRRKGQGGLVPADSGPDGGQTRGDEKVGNRPSPVGVSSRGGNGALLSPYSNKSSLPRPSGSGHGRSLPSQRGSCRRSYQRPLC